MMLPPTLVRPSPSRQPLDQLCISPSPGIQERGFSCPERARYFAALRRRYTRWRAATTPSRNPANEAGLQKCAASSQPRKDGPIKGQANARHVGDYLCTMVIGRPLIPIPFDSGVNCAVVPGGIRGSELERT